MSTLSQTGEKKTKTSPLVIRGAVIAAVGGLVFGFDTAVISGANPSLRKVFNLGDFGIGLTVAMATIGTILGAIVAGRLADKYGRKKMLFVIGILFVLGALGTALATSHAIFMFFRAIGGVGVGMSSVCAPIYTAEIAPAAHRGRLVGLVQFNIVLGILLAYLSNFVIHQIFDEDADTMLPDDLVAWRWMLGVMAFPSLIFLAMLLLVPETPRWLMAHGKDAEAVAVSRRLCTSVEESEEQIAEIRDQIEADRGAHTSLAHFFSSRYIKVILLAFAIAAFNQLSGINAVLYYAPEVMKDAGATDDQAMLMSVAVGFMNLVATMAALTVIDKVGRRTLMLVGSIGYIVSLGFLTGVMFVYEGHFNSTSSILVLVGLLAFIAAHAFGQGAVIWVFISEIFPNRVRGMGQSLGSLTHWSFAALTTFAFPPLIGALGGGVAFSFFLLCMVGQLFWVLKVMPETKGIPLEKMAARLGLDK